MDNKIAILRAINILQQLSQSYRILLISEAEDIMDTDQVSIGEYAENMLLLAETSIKELQDIIYLPKCSTCKGKGFIIIQENHKPEIKTCQDCGGIGIKAKEEDNS